MNDKGVVLQQGQPVVVVTPDKIEILWVYILWLFLGLLGVHHFYIAYKRGGLTYWISGLLMLGTFGGFFVWWAIDIILNMIYVTEANKTIEDNFNNKYNTRRSK